MASCWHPNCAGDILVPIKDPFVTCKWYHVTTVGGCHTRGTETELGCGSPLGHAEIL